MGSSFPARRAPALELNLAGCWASPAVGSSRAPRERRAAPRCRQPPAAPELSPSTPRPQLNRTDCQGLRLFPRGEGLAPARSSRAAALPALDRQPRLTGTPREPEPSCGTASSLPRARAAPSARGYQSSNEETSRSPSSGGSCCRSLRSSPSPPLPWAFPPPPGPAPPAVLPSPALPRSASLSLHPPDSRSGFAAPPTAASPARAALQLAGDGEQRYRGDPTLPRPLFLQ